MRVRRTELLADPGYVEKVLTAGEEKANALANSVLSRVRSAVGLR